MVMRCRAARLLGLEKSRRAPGLPVSSLLILIRLAMHARGSISALRWVACGFQVLPRSRVTITTRALWRL